MEKGTNRTSCFFSQFSSVQLILRKKTWNNTQDILLTSVFILWHFAGRDAWQLLVPTSTYQPTQFYKSDTGVCKLICRSPWQLLFLQYIWSSPFYKQGNWDSGQRQIARFPQRLKKNSIFPDILPRQKFLVRECSSHEN